MLVYTKAPRGVLHIGEYKIYGRLWGQKPADIPFSIYKHYRKSLADAPYREGYIKEKTGKDCPEICFTYSELRFLPVKTIDIIGNILVAHYDKKWPYKRKIECIKRRIIGGDLS